MTTAYAAMRDALVVADREGAEWTHDHRLDGRDLECVAVSPEVPERAFVGTFESGLHRTTNGGETFERVGEAAIEQDAVLSAAVSPHDPDVVYAGTEPSRLYRSTDGGDTWTRVGGLADLPSADEWSFPPRPDTHHVRWVEPDPHDPDRLYVGIEAGALLLTEDGGETWEHPESGLDHRYCWSLAVDPADPNTVLMSAASGAYSAHTASRAESYLYRKRGDGDWFRLTNFPAGEGVVRAVLAAGDEAGECYAATNEGLYRTADAGDHWERVPVPWERFAEHTCRGLAVV
jgi:photosystem II stability/assembly factor-like uncharacterized protein